MIRSTRWRANAIVRREEVKLLSCVSSIYHFSVKQRSGDWADVWLTLTDNGPIYNCNAIDKDKKWGCVFHTGEKNKPYCSHSYAVYLYLKRKNHDTRLQRK